MGMLQSNLLHPAPTSDFSFPTGPTFEDEWAQADSIEEKERILNERIGEIDFERSLDELNP